MPLQETITSSTDAPLVVEELHPSHPDAEPTQEAVAAPGEAVEATPPEPESTAGAEETAPQDPKLAARFATLAKRERQLQERERQLKAQAEKVTTFERAWENAKQNPLGVLEHIGITYDDLTNYILNDNKPTEQQKLKQIDEELQSFKRAQKEAQEQSHKAYVDQQINQFKHNIVNTVNANQEKYELIHAKQAYQDIYDVVEENLSRTGQLISIEVAADWVENYLTKEAETLLKTKRFSAKSTDTKPTIDAKTPNTAKTSPTLTNKQVTSSAPVTQSKTLSRDESIRAAAKLLEDRLNKKQ